LALNGDKDVQVTADDNLKAIETALKVAGNTKYEIIHFSGLNHLFQTANTGLPNEYGNIEETVAPKVLQTITEWIQEKIK
jgi:uncharacterized protein